MLESPPYPDAEPETAPDGLNGQRCALSLLELLELLAADWNTPFDRLRASADVREHATEEVEATSRLAYLSLRLASVGLIGRLRRLSGRDAVAACRDGARLVAAAPLATGSDGWIYIRAAGRTVVCLGTADGTNVAISYEQLWELLDVDSSSAELLWLIPETALPFNAEPAHATADGDSHESHISPLQRLIAILRPEMKDIWIVSLFSAVVSLLALATPVTVEALVNTVAFGRLMQPVVVLSFILLTFLGFAAAIRALQVYVAEIIQRRLFVRVVADLSQRLPRVRHDSYDGVHGPELLNRFFDVMTVQKSAALLVLDGIAIVLQSLVGMAVLAFYHPLLLGFDVLLMMALGFVIFILGRGGVRTSIEESKAKYAVAAWLEQLALCPVALKNSGGAEWARERADQLAIEYLRTRESHFAVLFRQVGFTLGLQALAGSVLLGIGGWLVINGQLTLGQLVAAELIVALLVGSFTKLGKHMEAYYDLLAAVDKLGHLFDLPVERHQGEPLRRSSSSLRLEIGSERVGPSELVALTGPTGSGKSHLLDAVFGLTTTDGAMLQIDGIAVSSLEPRSLRSMVALVRGCEIFAATIAENIHMNRPEVTRASIRAGLEELGMRGCLDRFSTGLDTLLQPSGDPLTDSEARCIVLARALAGRPRLLLVDGLLDGMADDVLPTVLQALRRHAGFTTIVLATGRQDIAASCNRTIALANVAKRSHSPATLAPTISH
jgi:ABC-type bacteriocin/lantibiotic exporter with double-glycine peptidase domain